VTLAAFRDLIKWDCRECGQGADKPTPEHGATWEARGKCGGPLLAGKYIRPRFDDTGPYLTPLAFARDAMAPCFKPEERFYTCPVAIASEPLTALAYDWHSVLSKPGRRDMLPRKLSAIVAEAVREVDSALASRDRYETAKLRKG